MTIRKPVVSGLFYPENKDELNKMLEKFFRIAQEEEKSSIPVEKIKALIVPHAGYIYSGQTAARAYNLLKDISSNSIEKIILLGPSHQVYTDDMHSDENTRWETPLGLININDEFNRKLNASHKEEHSLEVQIPFLQYILGNKIDKIEILPLVVGYVDIEKASNEILELMSSKTLLIISTDLSHFHSKEEAEELDSETINAIKNLKPDEMQEACGINPIKILLNISKKKNWKIEIIDHTDSSDISGDENRVVGYLSSVAYEE